MGFVVSNRVAAIPARTLRSSSSASSLSGSSSRSGEPSPRQARAVRQDRLALLPPQFKDWSIEDIFNESEDLAQYLTGEQPDDMDNLYTWCRENGATQLCVQAAFDCTEVMHVDIADTETLHAMQQFGAPHGVSIYPEPRRDSISDDEPFDTETPPLPQGLPLNRPTTTVALLREALLSGKVTSVNVHLSPVDMQELAEEKEKEVWDELLDCLGRSPNLESVSLSIDMDNERATGRFLQALADNPSPALRNVTLNMHNLVKIGDDDKAAMAELLRKPGLECLVIASKNDAMHQLVSGALAGAPIEGPLDLTFLQSSVFPLLGSLDANQPNVHIIARMRGGHYVMSVQDTLLERILTARGTLGSLTLTSYDASGAPEGKWDTCNDAIRKALEKTSVPFAAEAASSKFGGDWDKAALKGFLDSVGLGRSSVAVAQGIASNGYLGNKDLHAVAATTPESAASSNAAIRKNLQTWGSEKLREGQKLPRVVDAIRKKVPYSRVSGGSSGQPLAAEGSLLDVDASLNENSADAVLRQLAASPNAKKVKLALDTLSAGTINDLMSALGGLRALQELDIRFGPGVTASSASQLMAALAQLAASMPVPVIRMNGVRLQRGQALEVSNKGGIDFLARIFGNDETLADSMRQLLGAMDISFTPEMLSAIAMRQEELFGEVSHALDALPVSQQQLPQ